MAPSSVEIECLAQIIREVDGNHDLGAAALSGEDTNDG